MITNAQFRQDFPAFADTARFPDGLLSFWGSIAYNLFNASLFDAQMLDTCAELYVAHNASLERRAMDESALGGQPGVTTGPVNSKSTDKVSIGYDTAKGAEDVPAAFNGTIYGIRLWNLIQIFGAVPIQTNVGYPPSWFNGGFPYFGPYLGPGWFGQ